MGRETARAGWWHGAGNHEGRGVARTMSAMRPHHRPGSRLLLAGMTALLLAVVGCTGEPAEDEAAATPAERLAAAQERIEQAEAITIALTSTGVPGNVDGVQSATGTGVIEGEAIAFEGEFQGRVGGITANAAILAVGEDAYMKLFTPDYEPVDLTSLGAPNPTAFFAPDTGIASLIEATTDLAEGGEPVRQGREVLDQFTGSLPGAKVETLLHLGGPDTTFDVTYGLTGDNELRTAILEGEFYEGAQSVYTLLLTDYGAVIPIEAPSSTATPSSTASP